MPQNPPPPPPHKKKLRARATYLKPKSNPCILKPFFKKKITSFSYLLWMESLDLHVTVYIYLLSYQKLAWKKVEHKPILMYYDVYQLISFCQLVLMRWLVIIDCCVTFYRIWKCCLYRDFILLILYPKLGHIPNWE